MPRQQLRRIQNTQATGSGGMATVYKAVQKSLDRPVAIKELKKAYHADDQIVRRFERESKVAASLQHENIVHIYDYWKKPAYCIVMEYVDGANLADVIEKIGALPIDVGIMIAIQVCHALDYAHMRGLIHRDIKPSNIMIKRNGEVKLMDFGIAQSRNLESLTMPGTLIGTPAYMSPEQVLGQPLDARSDIFSFGIVLYEMLTGVKPFTDDEGRSVSAKILKDKFLPRAGSTATSPAAFSASSGSVSGRSRKGATSPCLRSRKNWGNGWPTGQRRPPRCTRIADYLVAMKVFEAAPAEETVIITGKPRVSARFRNAVAAGSALLLLGAGGRCLLLPPDHGGCRAQLQPPRCPAAFPRRLSRGRKQLRVPDSDRGRPVPSGMPDRHGPRPQSSPSVTTKPAQTLPPASVGKKHSQTAAERKRPLRRKRRRKGPFLPTDPIRLPLIRSNIRLGRLSCAVYPVSRPPLPSCWRYAADQR